MNIFYAEIYKKVQQKALHTEENKRAIKIPKLKNKSGRAEKVETLKAEVAWKVEHIDCWTVSLAEHEAECMKKMNRQKEEYF